MMRNPVRKRWDWLMGGVLFISCVIIIVIGFMIPRRPSSNSVLLPLHNGKDIIALHEMRAQRRAALMGKIVIDNEYTVRDGQYEADWAPFLQGKQLVEPNRQSRLSLQDWPLAGVASSHEGEGGNNSYKRVLPTQPEDGDDNNDIIKAATALYDAYSYTWTIISPSGQVSRYHDVTPTHSFTELEEHSIFLQVKAKEDGADVLSTSLVVLCRYVRREIRSLTDTDRNEVLDAMAVMWNVDDVTGVAKYGSHYASIHTLTQLHFRGAAAGECDHFHEGMGFLTSHILMTNRFEASLQAVNPKVALPYWDMTIESHDILTLHDGDSHQLPSVSPLFQQSWFGTTNHLTKEVVTGRWAATEIPLATEVDKAFAGASPYGLLRSAWSSDSRKVLNRGMGDVCGVSTTEDIGFTFPTCSIHYELNQRTSFYDYVYGALSAAHGSVHRFLGGYLDCETVAKTFLEAFADKDGAYHFISVLHDMRKIATRAGVWSCVNHDRIPLTISSTKLMESGICGCHVSHNGYDDMETVTTLLAGFTNGINTKPLETESDDVRKLLAKTLCTGVFDSGDALLSSAPLDPIFWLIHPTMERLLHVKYVTNPLENLDWPDYSTDKIQLSSLSPPGTPGIEDCYGHAGSDVFPFGLLGDELNLELYFDGNWAENQYTNREILAKLNPLENSLGYVYDNFKWPHCQEEGIFIGEKLTATQRREEKKARQQQRQQEV